MLASYSDDVPDAERRNCTDPAGLAQLRATGEYLARMRGTQRGAFVLNGNHVAAKPGDWPPDTDPGRNSRSSRGML